MRRQMFPTSARRPRHPPSSDLRSLISFLGRVPGHFNIYVFNKTKSRNEIHVRLRGDKLQESEHYQRIQNETSVGISGSGDVGQGGEKGAKTGGKGEINVAHKREEESRNRRVFSCLTQGYGGPQLSRQRLWFDSGSKCENLSTLH